jgi:outer membrane protein OmpA-like peptidoglycan-associated protein
MKSSVWIALCLAAGCGSKSSPPTIPSASLPSTPDFATQDARKPAPTPAPASDGERPIAPEDQVFFGHDSDDLDPQAMALLDDVAAWARSNPDRTVLVQGHADPSGSMEHNLELSARRAQAVGSYLKDKGVAEEKITVAAQGEEGAEAAPAEVNRRVIIYATSIESASR